MVEEMLILLASASGAAAIKLIDGIIQWYLKRRDKQEASEELAAEKQNDEMSALKAGMRIMMLDRIQHLCKAYIAEGEVDYDDRRRLHIMHKIYHDELEGNGDLDLLMHEVDELPLKTGR